MATNVLETAAGWVAQLVCAESVAPLLPELDAWLREDAAHVTAFAEARRAWRLAEPLLRIAQPGAGSAQIDAFFEALEHDSGLSPPDFTDF